VCDLAAVVGHVFYFWMFLSSCLLLLHFFLSMGERPWGERELIGKDSMMQQIDCVICVL
jgi:hypothetical protein